MVDAGLEVLGTGVVGIGVDGLVVSYCDDRDEFLEGVEVLGGADEEHFDDEVQVLLQEGREDEGVDVLHAGQQLQHPDNVLLHL